jgi:hypothetical protein
MGILPPFDTSTCFELPLHGLAGHYLILPKSHSNFSDIVPERAVDTRDLALPATCMRPV